MIESRVLTPPAYLNEDKRENDSNSSEKIGLTWREIGRNFIYLFGPIQGAEDWQKSAIEIIHSLNPDLQILSPRRIEENQEYSHNKKLDQIEWERHHIEKTWRRGVSMFWLLKESEHIGGRSYAQTSRFELGESKIRHELSYSKLVVGIQNGFSGENYIKNILSKDCRDVPIKDSLKETCKEAVRLIKE